MPLCVNKNKSSNTSVEALLSKLIHIHGPHRFVASATNRDKIVLVRCTSLCFCYYVTTLKVVPVDRLKIAYWAFASTCITKMKFPNSNPQSLANWCLPSLFGFWLLKLWLTRPYVNIHWTGLIILLLLPPTFV